MNLSQKRELVKCILREGQANKTLAKLSKEEIRKFESGFSQFYGQELGNLDTWQGKRYERIFEEIIKELKTNREGWKGSLELKWTISIHALKGVQVEVPQLTSSHVEYYVMRLLTTMKDRLHVCRNGICQILFLGRPDQRFCTPTCRNNMNVRTFRVKKKYQTLKT